MLSVSGLVETCYLIQNFLLDQFYFISICGEYFWPWLPGSRAVFASLAENFACVDIEGISNKLSLSWFG